MRAVRGNGFGEKKDGKVEDGGGQCRFHGRSERKSEREGKGKDRKIQKIQNTQADIHSMHTGEV